MKNEPEPGLPEFDRLIESRIEDLYERRKKLNRLLELQSEVHQMEVALKRNVNLALLSGVVIKVVCDHYELSWEQVSGSRRNENLVIPRHIIFFILVSDCNATTTAVGKLMCRDHGTVIHAIRRVEERAQTDLRFAATLVHLRERCHKRIAEIGEP